MKNKAFVLFSFLFFLNACSYQESETEQAERLCKTYQLDIKAGDTRLFFPEQFLGNEGNSPTLEMQMTTLAESSESLDGIEAALTTYPQGFVTEVIDAIYLSGPMLMEGAEAGGTYSSNSIILVNISEQNGTNFNFENSLKGVHHELSSLIYIRSPFVLFAWQALLPKEWEPVSSNYEALTQDRNIGPDYENGFLSRYGKTNAENDFNIYAEFTFAEPEKLRELAATYPIIAKKLSLFITAYTQVFPEYQQDFEDYFTRTGLSDVAVEPENVEVTIQLDLSNIKPKIIR
ncbi:hypothetical protein H5119_17145 [Pseudoalteromonas sp. SG45-5]|uniref:hypothetical protein n=1 Tax=unclassified Pseudoalteromonas TaxID=194690 RepID=UPI0015FA2AB1|nr:MULTISPECIES: hypothetical protein [unclassified Pseudoalteromonas]MBB1387242.1 hypothetical protein [Pseudoalteromonas sp. SG45-5]MBB1395353.1 hypothetical protein [Pseudoalteromonas sp. SG44-4]MBB1449179.1 hypothetical protein [Pseudoalteromonas sp. SG41-6]